MTISRHGLSVNVVKYIHGMCLSSVLFIGIFFLLFFHSFLIWEIGMKIIGEASRLLVWTCAYLCTGNISVPLC